MASINKRLDDLEKTKGMRFDMRRRILLPDNGRSVGGFHVSKPTDCVQIYPTRQSRWPDGSFVVDSLTNPVSDGKDLTAEQWTELREAEPHHRKKGDR